MAATIFGSKKPIMPPECGAGSLQKKAPFFRYGVLVYVLLFLGIGAAYFFFYPIGAAATRETAMGVVMQLGLITVALCLLYLFKKGMLTMQTLLIAVIVCGIIMRVGYMMYTPISVRQHDVQAYNQNGHFGYMYRLFTQGALPDNYSNQLYHPPLMHVAGALLANIVNFFRPGETPQEIFDAVKIISCFASCGILLVTYKICRQMRLDNAVCLIVLAVIAFHPTFYILSASINNDVLMIFFFLCAFLYTMRWYESPSFKHIILLALCIGLAMMTKLSGGLIAVFTGFIFLVVLFSVARMRLEREKPPEPPSQSDEIDPAYYAVLLEPNSIAQDFPAHTDLQNAQSKSKPKSFVPENWKNLSLGALFGQFAVFLSICVPLGLWYQVRNFFMFGQPFGYVPRIAETSTLYCGGHSILERFFLFPLEQLLNPLYCKPRGDYNVWLYTIKCSIFGEGTFRKPEWIASALIVVNLLLILLSLAAMVYVMLRCKKTSPFARYGLFFIWLMQMVTFIQFNLQYPFGCTMDFRYIVPTAITGAVYLAIAIYHLWQKKKKWANALVYFSGAAIFLFLILSILFYTTPSLPG